jgi:membrane protein YqaA with SNARE-associated domain
MKTDNLSENILVPSEKVENFKLKIKSIMVIAEVSFVLILLVLWLSFETFRKSKNLSILFLYNFPSQFLLAVVPHEPVFLYFSKFYLPLTVTLIAIAGTLITEYINYSVFQYVSDFKLFKKMLPNKWFQKLVGLFNKAPFLALWIAGFTPIPFYPFRFIVVIAHYPLIRYLLAVFLSRTPRFYLLALFGRALRISNASLLIFFVFLILIANIQFLPNVGKWIAKKKTFRDIRRKIQINPKKF